MIARVVRGSDMAGLMRYLAGPGRDNEHSEPHLVAGDGAVLAWWGDVELDRAAANRIGGHLDRPRTQFAVDVAGGHVWHCSLSVGAADGQLSDERWGQIAREFTDECRFTPASGKAGCRWAAVRHGLSKAGNDHVHLVVSLVRDDGTKASTWHDWKRASAAAAGIEVRHGLSVITAREVGRGAPGVTAAEVKKSARLGEPEPARMTVARQVRAYAVASRDEAEFVRRARAEGLLIRPRFAADRPDVVLGYSVAARPKAGDRPVWFGGGHLGRDLALPRLRESWPDTPQAASAAVAEWTAAARHRRPVTPGRETRVMDPGLTAAAARDVTGLRQALRQIPLADRAGWARVAHDTAGVFAAWSTRLEPVPGPFAATADALARSAQLRSAYVTPRPAVKPVIGQRVAMLLLQAADVTPHAAKDAVLFRQLIRTAQAVHAAVAAAGDTREAAHLARVVRDELTAAYPVAVRSPAAGTSSSGLGGSGVWVAPEPDTGSGPRPGAPPRTPAARSAAAGVERSGRAAVLDSPLPADLDPEAANAVRLLRAARAHPVSATAVGPHGPSKARGLPDPVGPERDRDVER